MILVVSSILILLFLLLSGIHIYWLLGGRWGSDSVYPTVNDLEKPIMPGPIPTFIVAFGLFFFACIVFLNSGLNDLPKLLKLIQHYGLWFISSIFMLRAIGDFNYLGFFKKVKQTKFAINDSKYYSPLCLIISILSLLLIVIN